MTVEEVEALRGRLGNRLNNVLCEMKPDYDDSIVGFNEAWDVMRKFFDDEVKRLTPVPSEDILRATAKAG